MLDEKMIRKINKKNIYFILLCVLSGIGSIVFGIAPLIGSIFIILGIFGTIFTIISSSKKEAYNEMMIDILAGMQVKGIQGNPYLELIKKEMKEFGRSTDQIKKIYKALSIEPDNIEALEMLCFYEILSLSFVSWLCGSGNLSKVKIKEIKKNINKGLAVNSNNAVFMQSLGILYDLTNDYEKARECFSKLLEETCDPGYHALIATSWGCAKEYRNALDEMLLAKNEGDSGWLIDFYLARAYAFVGEPDKALENAQKAYSVNKSCPELLDVFMQAYRQKSKFYLAAKYSFILFCYLFFVYPKKSFLYLYQGLNWSFVFFTTKISKKIWHVSKKNHLLAKIHCKLISPSEPEESLSQEMIEEGYINLAILHLEYVHSILPCNIGAALKLALCYYSIKNRERAIEILDEILTLEPNNELVKQNKTSIETEDFKVPKIRIINKDGSYKDKEIRNI